MEIPPGTPADAGKKDQTLIGQAVQKFETQSARQAEEHLTRKTENLGTLPDRNMKKWIGALALLSGALLIAGLSQIGLAILQWQEMQMRDVERHNLAVATANLAAVGRSQASKTSALIQATHELAAAMKRQPDPVSTLVPVSARSPTKVARGGQDPYISGDASNPLCQGPKFVEEGARSFMAWRVCYTNTGKKPAIVDSERVFMRVGVSHFKCAHNCSKNESTRLNPGERDSIIGFWPMTKAGFEDVMKERQGPTIVVFFHYRDASGDRYTGDICLSHQDKGGFVTCSGMYRERDMR